MIFHFEISGIVSWLAGDLEANMDVYVKDVFEIESASEKEKESVILQQVCTWGSWGI